MNRYHTPSHYLNKYLLAVGEQGALCIIGFRAHEMLIKFFINASKSLNIFAPYYMGRATCMYHRYQQEGQFLLQGLRYPTIAFAVHGCFNSVEIIRLI